MRKKGIVEADRAKLVAVMAELDEKKRTTLRGACVQVNRDFGAMFATLLPGAEAKLEPPPGREVLDGLEVRGDLETLRDARMIEIYTTNCRCRYKHTYMCI